jgi:carotenoid cleavage dioxygenase-like enzyme
MQMTANRFQLGFANTPETDPTALRVEGRFPEWLSGVLVRNGPGTFDLKHASYRHWFDGLALLHSFAFAEGAVSYTSRYLNTPSYREDSASGTINFRGFASDPCRSLFKRAMSLFTPTPEGMNTNVNITRLGDDFIAMTETPMAIAFDPRTLETLYGYHYHDGKDGTTRLEGNVTTAHPHYDPARRLAYNYLLKFGMASSYELFSIEGGARRPLTAIHTTLPAYIHSFGMTERYLVLVEFSLVLPNPLTILLADKPFIEHYRWEPQRSATFHIIDKENGRVVTRAEADAFFAFHHVNAFERDGEIVVDVSGYDDARLIDELRLDHLRGANPTISTGRLRRYRIPLSGKRATYETIGAYTIELPRIHYRAHNGKAYRYAYGAGTQSAGADFLNQLIKIDTETGASVVWHESDCYPGEPVFVPTPGGRAEDDGVILSVVLDSAAGASFLLALDAQTFTEIGRARTPVPVPFGFHGQYFDV